MNFFVFHDSDTFLLNSCPKLVEIPGIFSVKIQIKWEDICHWILTWFHGMLELKQQIVQFSISVIRLIFQRYLIQLARICLFSQLFPTS